MNADFLMVLADSLAEAKLDLIIAVVMNDETKLQVVSGRIRTLSNALWDEAHRR